MILLLSEGEAAAPTNKQWITAPRVLLLILALLLAGYIGLKIFINLEVQKLERMLADVQSLKPGISSGEEAMRIAAKYPSEKSGKRQPCAQEQCTLKMHVTWCDPNMNPISDFDNWIWSRLGIHCWEGWSWVIVENKLVASTGGEIDVEGSGPQDRWHEANWSLDEQIPAVDETEEKQFLHNFNRERDQSPAFLVDWTDFPHGNRAEILFARISTRATGEQRRAAQNFNLDCLTRMGECSSVCDLLPGAARYYNNRLSAVALSFPHPQCTSSN